MIAAKRLSLVHRDKIGNMVLPRGAVGLVRRLAAEFGVDLVWGSAVVGPDLPSLPAAALGVDLRPYQEAAVGEMIRRAQALLVLPCGGGKTSIGAAGIVRLGLPALVVAPTREILDQWRVTLDRMGASKVYTLTGSKSRAIGPGDVALATASALRSGSKSAAVLQQVGVLVVDEVHRSVATTYLSLLERCPARYRWGLTATPERSDHQEWALPYLFGEPVIPATTEDLIAGGWLVRPTVLPVRSGWSPDPDLRRVVVTCPICDHQREHAPSEVANGAVVCRCGSLLGSDHVTEVLAVEWAAVMRALSTDPARHELLVSLIEAGVKGGRMALGLVPTVAQVRAVVRTLRDRGVDVAGLSGEETITARRDVMARLRSGRIQGVIATKVADEGLDVPDLDLVISANPGRSKGRALQRAGRSMRPGGLPPVVVDVVDGDELENQWMVRRSAYARNYGKSAFASWRPVDLVDALAYLSARPG